MPSAIISKLKVENFETWKAIYDGGEGMRRELGVRGVTVFRDATDPNLVTIITRFDSVEAARKMVSSDRFKATIKATGTPPEVFFTEQVDDRTY